MMSKAASTSALNLWALLQEVSSSQPQNASCQVCPLTACQLHVSANSVNEAGTAP